MGGGGPGRAPPRWLDCPRKSERLIGSRFLAFKTPLDERYDDQVPPANRFSPTMLFQSMKAFKVKIGLWIDLTKTSRYYNKKLVEEQGCKYVQLPCKGHGESPDADVVSAFISICRQYISQNPLDIVGVHCTHGFNRTGFLISAFMIEEHDWSVDAAVQEFRSARAPGIYKGDYLRDIYVRYGMDAEDAPPPPDLPDWCFEEEASVDDDGEPIVEANGAGGSNGSGRKGREGGAENFAAGGRKGGKFMEGVPGVSHFTLQPKLSTIQRKVQRAVGWSKGFPGAQPVSMDRKNIGFLAEKPYMVSWKADGTRYMMLVDGENEVYFLDRDNCVFQVSGLTFLHRKNQHRHIQDTVLDGEMVIDVVNGENFPRFLIYDIIRYEGNEACERLCHRFGKDGHEGSNCSVQVGKCDFRRRLECIDREIVGSRNKYIMDGVINKAKEPFSIRKKDFWDVADAYKLLRPEFTSKLAHEPDGLIFQPAGKDQAYKGGRDDEILKWKPASMNSVDFRLQVIREEALGCLPKTIGQLFVGQSKDYDARTPFSQIKVNKELKELNGKIIECKWEADQWVFMRERTDKSFPNGFNTAMGVIESIRNPVTEHYLLEMIDRSRWRKPQEDFHQGSMGPPPKRHCP